MTRRRTHTAALLGALVVAAHAMTACTSTAPATTSSGSTAVTAGAPGAAPSPATSAGAAATTTGPRRGESEGAFLYRVKCSGCHGADGEGNLGPALTGVADRLSRPEQLALVRTGRGSMIPFSPALTEEQIAAVVDYTRDDLR